MVLAINIFRTCGILFYFVYNVGATTNFTVQPWILSLKISAKECADYKCKYLLLVHGGEFLGHNSWRLTPREGSRGGSCEILYSSYQLREIKTGQWYSEIEVLLPQSDDKIYFCLKHSNATNSPFGGKWVHQGNELYLHPNGDGVSAKTAKIENVPDTNNEVQNKSDLRVVETERPDLLHDTDVNYLSNIAKPRREERNDIEVRIGGEYVPLNEVSRSLNDEENEVNNRRDNLNYIYENLINEYRSDSIKKNLNAIEHEFNDNKLGVISNKIINRQNYLNDKIKERLGDIENEFNNKDLEGEDKSRRRRENQHLNNVINEEFHENVNIGEINDKVMYPTDYFNNLNERHIRYKRNTIVNEKIEAGTEKLDHQGVVVNAKSKRQVMSQVADFSSVVRTDPAIFLDGLRVEEADKDPKILEDGIPSVLAETKVTLRLFGQGLTSRTVIAFTHDALEYGQPCKFLLKGEYKAKEDSVTRTSALFEFWAPSPIVASKLFICAKNLKQGVSDPTEDEEKYIHQGIENWKIVATHNKLLPLWVALILILVCLTFSALFSGLNLGLMSLDRTELKIISNTGTELERKYARAIMPVRDHGNYLLCSILLGNVAVNSTFTILLDELTSGLFAVIFSTLSIVLLGEITPQAICSRHGLMVGARSIMITKAVMALTAPLAFPVSKLLDYFLGEEIGNVYNRERLKELVKVTTGVNDLDKDEVNIISGALELRKKTVSDIMTKLEDVYMLPITAILDFETLTEIINTGFSRIPVYEGQRGNIVTVLFIKDLAFVDPDDNTPLRTLCQYYQNSCNFVFEDVTLDIMFKQFKDGHKGHMAFVHRINNEGEGDPFYETIGLLTLEDVIEEMIQSEIVDETDVFLDNRTKRRRNKPQHKLQNFAAFAERHDHRCIHISPQLTLATFQFLNTSVDAFRPDTVSETVLRRLLKQDVIQHIKVKGKTKKDVSTYVFQQGKPVDYFVLILEGRVEVTVGRENLVFEAGPFTYFGVQALTQNVGLAESPTPSAMGSLQNINMDSMLRHTFVPDYSVRAITELYFLKVKRSLYLAAKRATLMEKGALSKGATNEQFDTEVDKLKPHVMELRQMSQIVISPDASPTSSDKEYIAKYLADKLARKYLSRSEKELIASSKYWTNQDSGRTDSQTTKTSNKERSIERLSINLADNNKNDAETTNERVGRDLKDNMNKYRTSTTTNESFNDHTIDLDANNDNKVETNANNDYETDLDANNDNRLNRRDSQIASTSKYWTNTRDISRTSESGLIRQYSATNSQEKSSLNLQFWKDDVTSNDDFDRKGNKKKAKFRTEKSLLTFHPHTESSQDRIVHVQKELDERSDSIKIASDSKIESEIDYIDEQSMQRLILIKLMRIIRLLEKKDQT